MSGSSSTTSSPEPATAAAVIVAGGSGRRMGGVRKQYLELCGEPVLLRALRPFVEHPGIGPVVVVLPAEDVDSPPDWLQGLPVLFARGGPQRGDSVRSGLARLPEEVDVVLVHDGARPFPTRVLIDRVLQRASSTGVVAALPATDTIKRVDESGRVVATLPRAQIWQAQTPQGFPRRMLVSAYERAAREGWTETDDAAIFERCGLPVVVVDGERDNLKITRPEDLAIAEAIARRAHDVDDARGP
ncbi:MAG TPA: 2-C-methyl-D-erythritol 4-phosphate cytidylyltransferase [Longimicrobiaceae bacterium]